MIQNQVMNEGYTNIDELNSVQCRNYSNALIFSKILI